MRKRKKKGEEKKKEEEKEEEEEKQATQEHHSGTDGMKRATKRLPTHQQARREASSVVGSRGQADKANPLNGATETRGGRRKRKERKRKKEEK